MPLLRRTLRSCAVVTGRIGTAAEHPAKSAHWRFCGGASHSLAAFGGARFAHGRPSLRLGIPPALAPSPKKSKGKPCAFGALAFFGSGAPHGSKAGPPLPRPFGFRWSPCGVPLLLPLGGQCARLRRASSPALPPSRFCKAQQSGRSAPVKCLARAKSGRGICPQLARALWRHSAPSYAFGARLEEVIGAKKSRGGAFIPSARKKPVQPAKPA